MSGGAVITGALLDVIPTQWRVEWTAMAGCGRRYPSLGAMSDRRPRAHVQVNYILTPQYWEPMRPRYLVRVRGQWGSSLRRSAKVMGAICVLAFADKNMLNSPMCAIAHMYGHKKHIA